MVCFKETFKHAIMNRNRTAGNTYERYICNLLKTIFPNVLTSRNESRTMDAKKVDLVNTEPYHFQIKLTKSFPGVDILDEMPSGENIIIWGRVKKAKVNFIKKGDYAIMNLRTLTKLINGQDGSTD
jgi:hypothetical protein